jgi:uncharacterized protein (DUF1778 family)
MATLATKKPSQSKTTKTATRAVPRNKVVKKSVTPQAATQDQAQNSGRLNCRISPAIKRQAEAAAQVLGQNITAFTETALAEKAQSVLADHERIVLSERDFESFVAALNDPAPPTPKLVRAMRAYEKLRAENPGHGL